MNTGASIRWSPHSTTDNQRFLKINSRDHELNLYNISQEVYFIRQETNIIWAVLISRKQKGKGTRCKLVSKHSKIPQIRVCLYPTPPTKIITFLTNVSALIGLPSRKVRYVSSRGYSKK